MSGGAVTECVFCLVLENGLYVGHDRRVVSFTPLNPVTEGHRLFIHALHSVDARHEPWLTGVVFEVAAQWGRDQVTESFNLITSAGYEATQTVRHLHVHYVPRREGDGLHLPWTGQELR